ncbi:MAG: ATP-dependent RecD-like DNA helicase [Candidatus Scatovivens sp.]
MFGKTVVHQDYGEQFKVETFEKTMPDDTKSLEKYLASGTIKGIGPATAKKIIDKFGEETISIFKFEPSRLSEIKGISKEKAIDIGEEFNEKWDVWQIVGYLEKFGIGPNNSKKVYDTLGKDAIEKIEQNPYILVDIVYGVDFKKIDKIAMEIGISIDNDDRIRSGIKYALLISSYNGNLCVNKLNLIEFVKSILNVDEQNIENNLINLNAMQEIYIEQRENEKWVYLYPLYKAEKNIAERLVKLNNFKNVKYIKHFKTELKKQEKNLDIILSEKQFEALEQINENNVCIITGGPGTGKTTIIKCLIEIYKKNNKKVVLCAPTGRAAKRISETTNEEAKTIHRLLEIGKIEDDKLANVDIDISPIDADIVVIDEMSMVDVFLMNYITKAVYLGTKIIFVGDSNQLPSVGPGSILKDIIESEAFSNITLNKIFRQAAKSKIIVNSHRVNEGVSFIGKGYDGEKYDDFFYINENNQEKIIKQVISLSNGRLKKYGNYDFFNNIQILTPTKKGLLGTKQLNKYLQEVLNPQNDDVQEKQYGDIIFREGDRVMQIKNNYDIYWEKGTREDDGLKFESGSGIFNGELGRVTLIDKDQKILEVLFDDRKKAWYSFSELDELEHAYAITIHKAQGSEFDVGILVIPQSSKVLLTRNLLYTGMTRAKKLLIIIGEKNLIEFMINNSDTKKRNTGLKYRIEELKQ